MAANDLNQELLRRRETIRQGGGSQAIEKQHAKGKLTARERHRPPARSRQLSGDRPLRHPSPHRLWPGQKRFPGDSVVVGLWPG